MFSYKVNYLLSTSEYDENLNFVTIITLQLPTRNSKQILSFDVGYEGLLWGEKSP